METNITYLNRAENKPYVLKEQLPEGSFVMEDPQTKEQYYITQQDLEQQDQWLKQMTQTDQYDGVVASIIDEAMNNKDIQRLREQATIYYTQWAGKKPVAQILQDFMQANDVTDTYTMGQVKDAVSGITTVASTTYPVLLHIAVDSPSKAIKAMLDEPEICMAVTYSKYAGYDLMVIGYPKPIRNILAMNDVYIDAMKTAPIPRELKHSFTTEVLGKLQARASQRDIIVSDAYLSYTKTSAEEGFKIIAGWFVRNNDYSLIDWIRAQSANKISELDKDFPLQVINDFDMDNGEPAESTNTDTFVNENGIVDPMLKHVMPIS